MFVNLLSNPITTFITDVFNFLVEKTGSKLTAYISLILVGVLAVALVVFIILAIAKGCKCKKVKAQPSAQNETVSESNQSTNNNADTVNDTVKSENAPTEQIETSKTNEDPQPAKKQPFMYDDGIPAMPIYRKSKYEKPRTILVKKDKSKLRNQENQNK